MLGEACCLSPWKEDLHAVFQPDHCSKWQQMWPRKQLGGAHDAMVPLCHCWCQCCYVAVQYHTEWCCAVGVSPATALHTHLCSLPKQSSFPGTHFSSLSSGLGALKPSCGACLQMHFLVMTELAQASLSNRKDLCRYAMWTYPLYEAFLQIQP